MNDPVFAAKRYSTTAPSGAVAVQCKLINAMQLHGYRKISQAIEYSPPWLTAFTRGEGALDLEGICRFLAAMDLTVSGQSADQLFIDELAAKALETTLERTLSHHAVDGTVTLTDEEYFQLKSMAQYGSRQLFADLTRIEPARSVPSEAA